MITCIVLSESFLQQVQGASEVTVFCFVWLIMFFFFPFFFYSPSQRSPEDLEVIYEELLHVKAAAHLSSSVSLYKLP